MSTGYESGLVLSCDSKTGKAYLSPAFKGGPCSLSTAELDPRTDPDFIEWRQDMTYGGKGEMRSYWNPLKIHFHPFGRGHLGLSRSDIYATDVSAEGDPTRPIVGVATADSRGECHMLLLQRTFDGRLDCAGELIDQIRSRCLERDHLWPYPDFGRDIEVPGYMKADVLQFALQKGSRAAVVANSEILSRFETNESSPHVGARLRIGRAVRRRTESTASGQS